MNNVRGITILATGLMALTGAITPSAKADLWNQKTIFTFSAPVEVPGQVLAAGTYVFKLADMLGDRNVVQIYNKDENHLYTTALAIPNYRLTPSSKPIITFEERIAGAPPAVKSWVYPGENYGHEFLYPKAKAVEMAAVTTTTQSMPSVSEESTATTVTPNPPVEPPPPPPVIEPAAPPVDETPAPPVVEQPAPPVEQQPAQPETLPKTGSSLPLIGLVGFLSLGIAGLLRVASSKVRVN